MKVYEIHLQYIWGTDAGEKTTARMEVLKAHGFDADNLTAYQINGNESIVCSSEQLLDLMVTEFGMVREVKEHSINVAGYELAARVEGLMARMERIMSMPTEKDHHFNERTSSAQPGQMMSLVNQLKLAEDVCTDYIQNCLNEGWRILAICPQPDQRRPDYIMGRYNPDYRKLEMNQKLPNAHRGYDDRHPTVTAPVTPLDDIIEAGYVPREVEADGT